MPIDVLYIHQDGSPTGSAISLQNLLSALDREQYHPRVLLGSDGTARKLYERLNVPVDVIPMRFYGTAPGAHWHELSYYMIWYALVPNPKLARYFQQIKPNLIHINDKSMLAAGLVASRLDLPVVWHLRSTYYSSHSRLQAWVSQQIIRSCATRLVAISEDESDGFENLSNLRVIYNSVDFFAAEKATQLRQQTRASLGIGHNEIIVGMVGHLSEVRGAWDFIEISGLVQRELPNADLRFLMMTPIPSRTPRSMGWRERIGLVDVTHPEDKAKHLAQRAGIAERLLITGYRDDPLSVLAAMDVFVSCSHYGVMGRPPFEAMSVGVSVAAWAGHTGKSRVVVDGETALVTPRWDKLALASAIVRLVSDKDLRRSMGEHGREYSQQHFDPHKNAQAVQQVYREVLQEKTKE